MNESRDADAKLPKGVVPLFYCGTNPNLNVTWSGLSP